MDGESVSQTVSEAARGAVAVRARLEAAVLARLDAGHGSASARAVRCAVPDLLAARVGAVVRGALWLSDGRVLGVAVTVLRIDGGVVDVRAVVDTVLPAVPADRLGELVADALARVRGRRPASVRLPHPMPALVGADVRGRLCAPDGSGIGLTVHATRVVGDTVGLDIVVDDEPDSAPRV